MTEDLKLEAITAGLAWAKGQPFTNLLLSAIFAAGCAGSYFALNTVIPTHLKAIQEGYEKLETSHREEREQRVKTYDKWIGQITGRQLPQNLSGDK